MFDYRGIFIRAYQRNLVGSNKYLERKENKMICCLINDLEILEELEILDEENDEKEFGENWEEYMKEGE